jgi:hypothetical protein
MKFKYLTNDAEGKFKKDETCFIIGTVYTNTGTIIHTVNESTGMICSCVAADLQLADHAGAAADLQLADHAGVASAPVASPSIFTVEDAKKMKALFGGGADTPDRVPVEPTKPKRSHHAERGKK